MLGLPAICPLSLLTLKDSSLGMETNQESKSREPMNGLQGGVCEYPVIGYRNMV